MGNLRPFVDLKNPLLGPKEPSPPDTFGVSQEEAKPSQYKGERPHGVIVPLRLPPFPVLGFPTGQVDISFCFWNESSDLIPCPLRSLLYSGYSFPRQIGFK